MYERITVVPEPDGIPLFGRIGNLQCRLAKVSQYSRPRVVGFRDTSAPGLLGVNSAEAYRDSVTDFLTAKRCSNQPVRDA